MKVFPLLRKSAPFLLLGGMVMLPLILEGTMGKGSTAWVVAIQEMMLFAVLALGLNITVGLSGLLVLGHAAFWALGAYTYAILTVVFGLSFWLALPLGALVAALAGFLLGMPTIRLRGDYLAIVTLGFGEVIRYVLKNFQSLTGGDQGIPGIGFKDGNLQWATGWIREPAALSLRRHFSALDLSGDSLLSKSEAISGGLNPSQLQGIFSSLDTNQNGLSAKELLSGEWGFGFLCPSQEAAWLTLGRPLEMFTCKPFLHSPLHWYLLTLLFLSLALLFFVRLKKSRLGRSLIALREDEIAAKSMGINTTKAKMIAFALSAAWAGAAGVLFAARNNFINPEFFKLDNSVLFLAMAVLGGLGSARGTVAGATILWLGPFLLREQFPQFQEYKWLAIGLLMALMMIIRPQGIFGANTGKTRVKLLSLWQRLTKGRISR
ncbi:hypothetical protein H8D30_04020 [bacterium]|nr:hypothetical protein [bacterium]